VARVGSATIDGEEVARQASNTSSAGLKSSPPKAKGQGYRGRKPSDTRDQLQTMRDILGRPAGIAPIAKAIGLSRQTIYRIKDDPAGSKMALASWGCEGSHRLHRGAGVHGRA